LVEICVCRRIRGEHKCCLFSTLAFGKSNKSIFVKFKQKRIVKSSKNRVKPGQARLNEGYALRWKSQTSIIIRSK
jgi:hypothetical protein